MKTYIQEAFQDHLSLCTSLKAAYPMFDWVGFYWMNDDILTLELGAYAGEATEHTRIPYGKGICGQVAESGTTFVVPDVHAQDNYLACSLSVQSEIVIPLYKEGVLIGQLDIDSHQKDAFPKEIVAALEAFCLQVAESL